MRVWRFDDSATKLFSSTDDVPQPGADEVLVRVHAAGVTPTEAVWYPTTHTQAGGVRTRAIPGHEFSGAVAAVGAAVRDVAVDEEIYGMNDWFAAGATAEYCLTKPEWIAPKPKNLTHAQAASVPIGALTAWQGLFDRAKLQPGERVLIHGGSGAVGVFAIQFARQRTPQVITTASSRNTAFLLQLGAERVIDHRAERFEGTVNSIDVVLDCVGGETLKRSWSVLAPTGRLVTIAADSEGTSDQRTKKAFFIVETNRQQLIDIAAQLESGKLAPVVDAVVPFDQTGAAYGGKVERRLGRGKVVIAIVD